ncbi:MAG: hypothetical protein JXA10_07080 [Anaerolineae bacterium]|nr:hypothetical protein [Anaerolineae bacterium]
MGKYLKVAGVVLSGLLVGSIFLPVAEAYIGWLHTPPQDDAYARISAVMLCLGLLLWLLGYARPRQMTPGYTPLYALVFGLIALVLGVGVDAGDSRVVALILFVLPFPFFTLTLGSAFLWWEQSRMVVYQTAQQPDAVRASCVPH